MSNLNTQKLGLFLVMGLGILFAWYAGNFVAEENFVPILAAIGGLLITLIYFGFASSIYVLIPICWGFTGQIPILPLPFTVRQLVIILASILFISNLIFKKNRYKPKFEIIDLWIWINILYLTTAFLRNPVGVAALGGSERVGGMPYVDVFLGVMSYLMLSHFKVSKAVAEKLPFFILAASFFTSFVGIFALLAPNTSLHLAMCYSGFNPGNVGGSLEGIVTAGETRLITLNTLGATIVLFVVCKVNPLRLFSPNNIKLLAAYLLGVLMILFSGFRTGISNTFIITAIATILRDRFEGFAKLTFASLFIGLLFIIFSYSGIELPFTFQRAFSFLPGHWSQEAIQDAKTSSDWRFEMWRVILSSDKYIRSKMWGDGFGFLRVDYETMMDSASGAGGGFEGENKDQEAFMISGDFHNGPLSTVRFVGYFGLALFLPLLFMMAIYAYRFIRLAEGTPFQFCAFFIGIPILSIPIGFLLIFGDYRTNLVELLFNVGLIKMLTASLRDYINQKNQSEGIHVGAQSVN